VVLIGLLLGACGPGLRPVGAAGGSGASPASLVVDPPVPGEPRSVRVRVWAAPEVRAEDGWRERLTDELDTAGQVMTPLLGVRLDVVEVRDWPLAASAQPGDGLADLNGRDPGDDVGWVIGVTAPARTALTAMVELVAAEPLTRHVVIRGYAASAEAEALTARWSGRGGTEETELLGEHRRHKQGVLLLHGLARTLAAIDEREPSRLQHPRYDSRQGSVSPRNRALMQEVVAARLGDGDVPELAATLLASIEEDPWAGWLENDLEARLRLLRSVVTAARADDLAEAVPAAAVAQYERARGMRQRGELPAATAELDPLIAAYPANAALRLLACDLELAQGGPSETPTANCARALALAPADPSAHVLAARAWAERGDATRAHAALTAAADVLVARKPPPPPGAWLELAAVYRGLGALTWTEALLARAGLDEPTLRDWIALTRARFGAPAGAAPPAEEGALVEVVQRALELINAKEHAAAAKALADGERRWPEAPGLAAMRCELAVRQDRLPAARRACEAAIARAPGTSWAQYLLGVLRLGSTRAADTAAGLAHLRAAIAADPDLAQAWRALGKALDRTGDAAGLATLRAEYQARFGRSL